ncbi:MAG: ribonuclease D [Alphaproteobacteria bacterium]|jgi:ribonuclease D|nr:ribonuclease H-like domain-containing protein [Candidatus Jidaibacter sp.]
MNKDNKPQIFYHQYDLPNDLVLKGDLAIDTEAMGLNNHRDRLCVIQISNGDNTAHVVHFPEKKYDAPNIKKLLQDDSRAKLFHFGRFDIAILEHYLQVKMSNVYCTKIASRLTRTYTDMHGLKDLCFELLEVKINKQQQLSNWGSATLTQDQINYAASDVLHLHALRDKLNILLKRECRYEMAQACFDFLPTRARLDLAGWNEFDILQH